MDKEQHDCCSSSDEEEESAAQEDVIDLVTAGSAASDSDSDRSVDSNGEEDGSSGLDEEEEEECDGNCGDGGDYEYEDDMMDYCDYGGYGGGGSYLFIDRLFPELERRAPAKQSVDRSGYVLIKKSRLKHRPGEKLLITATLLDSKKKSMAVKFWDEAAEKIGKFKELKDVLRLDVYKAKSGDLTAGRVVELETDPLILSRWKKILTDVASSPTKSKPPSYTIVEGSTKNVFIYRACDVVDCCEKKVDDRTKTCNKCDKQFSDAEYAGLEVRFYADLDIVDASGKTYAVTLFYDVLESLAEQLGVDTRQSRLKLSGQSAKTELSTALKRCAGFDCKLKPRPLRPLEYTVEDISNIQSCAEAPKRTASEVDSSEPCCSTSKQFKPSLSSPVPTSVTNDPGTSESHTVAEQSEMNRCEEDKSGKVVTSKSSDIAVQDPASVDDVMLMNLLEQDDEAVASKESAINVATPKPADDAPTEDDMMLLALVEQSSRHALEVKNAGETESTVQNGSANLSERSASLNCPFLPESNDDEDALLLSIIENQK